MNDKKYINVSIPEEAHRKLKIESAETGITMTQIVEEALRAKYPDKAKEFDNLPEKKPQKIKFKNDSELSMDGGTDKLEDTHIDGMYYPQPKKK